MRSARSGEEVGGTPYSPLPKAVHDLFQRLFVFFQEGGKLLVVMYERLVVIGHHRIHAFQLGIIFLCSSVSDEHFSITG